MNKLYFLKMARIKLIATVFFALFSLSAQGQTIDEARTLYIDKKYEEAKPMFEKFVKSNPNNANYNFWYGVSALNTNEAQKAIKPLELANKRRVPDAALYLGKAYLYNYQFDEAIKTLEDYIKTQERRKKNTTEPKALLEQAKINSRLIKGVEQVTVIDSIVVSKEDFLNAYKLSVESGSLSQADSDSTELPSIIYQTERGNKRYIAKAKIDAFYQLYTQAKIGNDWGDLNTISDLNKDSVSVGYPFMLSDGMTFYYASNSHEYLGGYDILVTRYNTSNDSFLMSDNVGMPFNSIYNDYMYVVDEFNNLGWFASDRFQKEGDVCIYIFIPNAAKRTYDFETVPYEELKKLASLEDIKLTWKDQKEVEDGLKRLEFARSYQPTQKSDADFIFIINDKSTYKSLKEFQSSEAREAFMKFQVMEKDFNAQQDKLSSLRDEYTETESPNLKPAILDLEKRIEEMRLEIKSQEKLIRSLELK